MFGNHHNDTATIEITEVTEMTDAPAAGSCCGHAAPAASSDDDAATCPVMAGPPVSKATAEAAGLFRDYEGDRYWFCCAACGPLFDADPSKYAAA